MNHFLPTKRKHFLFLLLIFCFYTFPSVNAQTDPSKPNILLIIADDLGVDVSNGYSNNARMPVTPHIDALRASGVTFMNAWAAPKCTPSRAAMMSGKYGIKTGVQKTPGNLDASHTSIFQALETQTNNAYADAVIGKWHLSTPQDLTHPAQMKIDHYEGVFSSGVGDYYNWEKVNTDGSISTITDYATTHITDNAIDWISNQNQSWFLWLAHVSPHSPFHEPPANMYTTPINNESNLQKFIPMIEALDFEIGRLMDNIPANVLANTVIIFVGDNGSPSGVIQGFPSNHAKGTIYEGGAHVPLIVSGAGVSRQNEQETALVHVSDMYATILEIAGGDLAGGINNSHSFKHLLSSTSGSKRGLNYTEFDMDWTMRDAQYKLLEFEDGTQEFYDLVADELEANNLINTLTTEQTTLKTAFETEAAQIRASWSCQDGIQNGDETGIDCGGTENCTTCTTSASVCSMENLIIDSEITVDSTIYAQKYIESAYPLSGDNAIMQAGDSVVLKAGFEFSGQNGTLTITIAECTDTGGGDGGIDDANCPNSNTTSYTNIGCPETPSITGTYSETLSEDTRTIVSNNFPNHKYGQNSSNQAPTAKNYTFNLDATPTVAGNVTSVLSGTGRPARDFGVALNGVIFAPAPATPFIFVNTSTHEYNWDWVFEPTNNQGTGRDKVGLDCSSAHTGPQGYHYHGNPFQYVEEVVQANLSTTNTPPLNPVQIGWAADGFPVLYRFGPDENGTMKELIPSYQLKTGNRPGDGIAAPCGSYNGKYTNDYEYVTGSGDLGECNIMDRSITLTTEQGTETFSHFYIISATFPQVPRCLVGTPSSDFGNFSGGFLEDYFSIDNEEDTPNLTEGLTLEHTSSSNILDNLNIQIMPNPTHNEVLVSFNVLKGKQYQIDLFNYQGQKIQQPLVKKDNASERVTISFFLAGYPSGVYIVRLNIEGKTVTHKIIKE